MKTTHAKTPAQSGDNGISESSNPVKQTRVTMFYDGGCPLCSREVAHYRRLDKTNRVLWVDFNATPRVLDSVGISYQEAMARLHVRDEAGGIQTGAWAFAAVWEQLPYYRWLARVVRTLHLLPAIEGAYTRFARWRLRRRDCASGVCEKP